MKEKTATFIGHSECSGIDENKVRSAVIELIENGITDFLSGGMGGFDRLCARVVYDLRPQYSHIRNYLVIPYLSFNVWYQTLFDEVIYPEGFEAYHFKQAIIKRNDYLVENSAYAICYVRHSWGGAAKTYEKAIKIGVEVIDL